MTPCSPLATAVLAAVLALTAAPASAQVADYTVVGDGIPAPLTATPGQSVRGRALIADNRAANCRQCHAFPDQAPAGSGGPGPSLDGVGARLTPAQLRLSVVDFSRVDARAAMPGFHRAVPAGSGAPRLAAQEVEDVVAYLQTLRIR